MGCASPSFFVEAFRGERPSATYPSISFLSSVLVLLARGSLATRGFSHQLVDLGITLKQSLDEVVSRIERVPMGATDCALPMLHAAEEKIPVDGFVIYTDNETWFGKVHPYQALRDYRSKLRIPAKLAVVGMTATKFTIADPQDPGTMDFVGFDSAAPAVLSMFATQ